MPSREPLSRGGLTSRAGLSEDIMTTWDRGGLFAPLPRRTPTARRKWPWFEASIAGIMMQMRDFGVVLEDMRQIANVFRDAISWMGQYDLSRDDALALWNYYGIVKSVLSDPAGSDHLLASFRDERHGPSSRITPKIEALAEQIEESAFRAHLDAYLIITEQPEADELPGRYRPDLTYFWRASDRWRFGQGEGALQQARLDGALATIGIDVSAVLYQVWNKPCAD